MGESEPATGARQPLSSPVPKSSEAASSGSPMRDDAHPEGSSDEAPAIDLEDDEKGGADGEGYRVPAEQAAEAAPSADTGHSYFSASSTLASEGEETDSVCNESPEYTPESPEYAVPSPDYTPGSPSYTPGEPYYIPGEADFDPLFFSNERAQENEPEAPREEAAAPEFVPENQARAECPRHRERLPEKCPKRKFPQPWVLKSRARSRFSFVTSGSKLLLDGRWPHLVGALPLSKSIVTWLPLSRPLPQLLELEIKALPLVPPSTQLPAKAGRSSYNRPGSTLKRISRRPTWIS